MEETTITNSIPSTTNVVATTPTPSNPSDTLGVIERAEKATKLLEDTEKRIDSKLAEINAVVARQMLSGRANAGQVMKSAEELKKEEIERLSKELTSRYS